MIRPVPRNEWDLDPAAFGPYGPRPFELAQHSMECMRSCRVLAFTGVVAAAEAIVAGVSGP